MISNLYQNLKARKDPVAGVNRLSPGELEFLTGAMEDLIAKPGAARRNPADEDEAALAALVYDLAEGMIPSGSKGFDEDAGAAPGEYPNLREYRKSNWCPPNHVITDVSTRLRALTARIRQLAPAAPNPAFPKV